MLFLFHFKMNNGTCLSNGVITESTFQQVALEWGENYHHLLLVQGLTPIGCRDGNIYYSNDKNIIQRLCFQSLLPFEHHLEMCFGYYQLSEDSIIFTSSCTVIVHDTLGG